MMGGRCRRNGSAAGRQRQRLLHRTGRAGCGGQGRGWEGAQVSSPRPRPGQNRRCIDQHTHSHVLVSALCVMSAVLSFPRSLKPPGLMPAVLRRPGLEWRASMG
eukprot:925366-Rhodomonas_salina.1